MKKTLFLLLALMLSLTLCLTACGGESGGNPNDNEQQPAHSHKYGEWVTIKKATCAENGEMARYCECGEKQTETLFATGEHTEAIDKAVAPTCTESGLTEGKHCSVCNEVLVAQTAVDPTGHTEVTDNAVAPTCTKEGLTEGKHCSVCSEVIVKQGVAPIVAHTYDDKYDESCNVCGGIRDAECAHTTTEPILGYAATCTEPGLTEGTKCKKCGEILTHQTTINAKGHTEVTDEEVAATCTASGLTKGKHCSACDAVLVKQSVVPTLPHTYGEWTVTKNANCGQDGEMARYCTCGAKQTEVIDGTGMHTEITDFAVAPTCTKEGLTEGKHCSYCNTILVQQTVIPMLEHAYNTTYSFDTSFHWYACRDCGFVKDKAEHTLDEGEMCTVCGEPIGPTVGIVYDKSADGTYAEVVGYNGSAKKIRIADTFEGLPVKTIYDKAFYQNTTITSVIIPDSVTTIGDDAFYLCSNLTSMVIPDSVTTIGNSAFSNCYKLTSVVIPDSVTTIGNQVFLNCSSLTSMVIPDSVTTIGSSAFSGCSRLKLNEYENGKYLGTEDNPYFALIELTTKNLSSYTIHEDTKIIANRVFSECERLTSITIPDSVTTIGNDAFSSCTKLKDVYYTGSEEEWKAITIGSSNNYYLTKATKHYNYVPEE